MRTIIYIGLLVLLSTSAWAVIGEKTWSKKDADCRWGSSCGKRQGSGGSVVLPETPDAGFPYTFPATLE